jgi:hypothetical protein
VLQGLVLALQLHDVVLVQGRLLAPTLSPGFLDSFPQPFTLHAQTLGRRTLRQPLVNRQCDRLGSKRVVVDVASCLPCHV